MKPFSRLFRKNKRFWTVLSSLALLGGIAFGFWSVSLFHQLELVTSQRATRRPAQFYADILTLKPGLALSVDRMVHRLVDRGYYGQSKTPSKEGQFQRLEDRRLEVYFNPFFFPDGRIVEGLHRLTFDDNRLQRIEKLPEGEALTELPLEPIALGDFSKDGVENRPWISLDKIPWHLKQAVLTCEDRRFYHHLGLDPRSLARALWVNVRGKGVLQGGSTLTQQLVKNAFLTQKRTLRRKITEAGLAVAMEVRYSKDEILTMYMNQIYLGQNGTRGVYGVEDASRSYFGKPVSDLTLGESALLVGLIPAPNANHPRASLEKAVRRRNHVLDLLLKQNVITQQEWQQAMGETVVLAPLSAGTGDYFLTWARTLLEQDLGGPLLDSEGYRVFTTLDLDFQKAAEKALAGQPLEGALVAMDPQTGMVRAMVGGRQYATSPYNRALFAYRHPGSAFKPILYAAALESRAVTLATLLEDKPLKIVQENGVWEPHNYDGQFRGTVTVRDALVYSLNIPAVEVLNRVGTGPVIELAHSLGIQSPLNPVPSLALGTSEVTPLELTAAYAAFANGGSSVRPLFIRCVTDAQGNVLKTFDPEIMSALRPETAALITDVLQDVVDLGTGRNARGLGFTVPAAGKTGTSDQFMDAWFIGYTPKLLCGVWLGHDQPASLGQASSSLALPVWVRFMKAAQGDAPPEDFPKNPDLVEIAVDPASGLLARSGCVPQRKELFLPGTEPKKYCPLHRGGVPGLFKRFFKWFGKEEKSS